LCKRRFSSDSNINLHASALLRSTWLQIFPFILLIIHIRFSGMRSFIEALVILPTAGESLYLALVASFHAAW